jgi:serine/threonine protein kinase/WD40 repeat protein
LPSDSLLYHQLGVVDPDGYCMASLSSNDITRQMLSRFEDAWHNPGPEPRIEEFVKSLAAAQPMSAAASLAILEELVQIDLECRWCPDTQATRSPAIGARFQCRHPRLEDYIACYPDLGPLPRLPVELIAEEYRVRQRWGDRPSHAEYAARFVQQWPNLRAALVETDEELAKEYARRASLGQPGGANERMKSVSSIDSVAALVDLFRQYELLDDGQISELAGQTKTVSEPRALAQQLIKQGRLTPYQVNQLFLGRGRDLLVGPYVVLERLGEGGAGQVFKARHKKMNRVVALKIIRKELLTDAEVVGRFHREVQVLSQLDHPNVVHAFDAAPAGPGHFLAMEHVEGTDLGRLVKQGGPMPVEQACAYICQAALGLQHAHERGLVHRDIKPHNLIMSVRDGQVKVADLGLARLPRAGNAEFTAALNGGAGTLTPANAVLMGTADYLAPEQALDFHRADIRADIYSLGCTFYYLLSGQPPFPGATLTEKLLRHQQAEPPPLDSLRHDLPTGLNEVLHKMLAKQPADRFQIPAEIVDALAAIRFPAQTACPALAGARQQALRRCRALAGQVFHRLRPERKSRRLLLAGIAGAFLVVLLLVALWRRPTGLDRLPGKPGEVVAVLGKPGQRRGGIVALSPDSRYVACLGPASGEQDQLVCLWDAETQKERSVSAPRGNASLTFAPDGKTLAYLSGGTVILWDIPSFQQRARFMDAGHSGIASFAIAPDSRLLAAGCGSGAVELWNVAEGTWRSTYPKMAPAGIEAIQFSPDGRTLALSTRDVPVTLCPVEGGQERRPTEWFRVIFGPTGRVAAVWQRTGPIKLWKPADSTVLASIDTDSPDGLYRYVAFSPDGKLLADARSHFIRLSDISSPKDPKMLNDLPVSGTTFVAFVPQRTTLVSVSSLHSDHKYHVWNPRSGQLLLQLSRKFASLALTADGRHMAIWGPYSDTVEIIRLPLAENPGGS